MREREKLGSMFGDVLCRSRQIHNQTRTVPARRRSNTHHNLFNYYLGLLSKFQTLSSVAFVFVVYMCGQVHLVTC